MKNLKVFKENRRGLNPTPPIDFYTLSTLFFYQIAIFVCSPLINLVQSHEKQSDGTLAMKVS